MTAFLILVWTALPILWFFIAVNLLAGRWYRNQPWFWDEEAERRWANKPWYVRTFEAIEDRGSR